MIYPSVNMLTGQPEKDYTKKPTEKQRTKKPTYLGYELDIVTEPQIFNPPKKMLVWDFIDDIKIKDVWAIAPRETNYRKPVHCTMFGECFEHCAEIPQVLQGGEMLNDSDKQCLEKIPPQDLREICDRAFLITKAAFGALRSLTFTYCSECEKSYPKKHLQKVPCFVSVLDMTSLCSNHYMQKLEKELCQKYLDEHKPKLDLTDFARL